MNCKNCYSGLRRMAFSPRGANHLMSLPPGRACKQQWRVGGRTSKESVCQIQSSRVNLYATDGSKQLFLLDACLGSVSCRYTPRVHQAVVRDPADVPLMISLGPDYTQPPVFAGICAEKQLVHVVRCSGE